jgi:hypothetical protein
VEALQETVSTATDLLGRLFRDYQRGGELQYSIWCFVAFVEDTLMPSPEPFLTDKEL